jgi:hypothetical protein
MGLGALVKNFLPQSTQRAQRIKSKIKIDEIIRSQKFPLSLGILRRIVNSLFPLLISVRGPIADGVWKNSGENQRTPRKMKSLDMKACV